MTTAYSYRPYRDGDSGAINALYQRVTGIRRSPEEFQWQWLQAPAGPGEMWLIEATHPDGAVELIGHHGIMPIRFTDGARDLVFGKTENTMVLPEYRRKILYPRMEQAFAKAYEPRFDALFSTTGPGEAIRQRAAMRYSMTHQWVRLERGTALLGSLALAASRLPRLRALLSPMTRLPPWSHRKGRIDFDALDPDEARREPFFDTYWSRGRLTAGIAPARFREDLDWRFWSNPYRRPVTFVTQGTTGSGLGIVDLATPSVARLLDWSFDGAASDAAAALAVLLAQLERQFKVRVASFSTTDDAWDPVFRDALSRLFQPTLLTRLRGQVPAAPMPRKITARGTANGVPATGWQVTPILYEGR